MIMSRNETIDENGVMKLSDSYATRVGYVYVHDINFIKTSFSIIFMAFFERFSHPGGCKRGFVFLLHSTLWGSFYYRTT